MSGQDLSELWKTPPKSSQPGSPQPPLFTPKKRACEGCEKVDSLRIKIQNCGKTEVLRIKSRKKLFQDQDQESGQKEAFVFIEHCYNCHKTTAVKDDTIFVF